MLIDSSERYGAVSRAFHWGMTLMLIWQGLSAFAHAFFHKSAFDAFFWPTHKSMGVALLMLMFLRLLWALTNRNRRPPSISRLATAGHGLLYALVLAIPSLALLRQYGSGRAFSPFGIPLFSGFEGRVEWMMKPASLVHGKLGWTLFALILGHVLMVVVHRMRGRADILRRMA